MQKSKWGLLSLFLAFGFGGYFSSEAGSRKAATDQVSVPDVSVQSTQDIEPSRGLASLSEQKKIKDQIVARKKIKTSLKK